MNKTSEIGMTLLSVLVSIAIGLVVTAALLRLLGGSFAAYEKLQLDSDYLQLRQLMALIDCNKSFEAAAIDPANPSANCNSTSQSQVGPFFILYQRSPVAAVSMGAALESDGSFRIGRWSIRASCSRSEQTLIVRAAQKFSDTQFRKDPLTGQPLDWDHPRSLLVGRTHPKCFQIDSGFANPIFISSQVYDGNLGGLAGGDSKCQSLATSAGFSGTWMAILSDGTTNARDRLSVNGSVMNVHGEIVANNLSDLFDGSPAGRIKYNERGLHPGIQYAWTGTDASGQKLTDHCNNWTTNAPATGGVGSITGGQSMMIHIGYSQCQAYQNILCIRQ